MPTSHALVDRPDLDPTDEQIDILNHLRKTGDNILINALAGSGKTSTLEMMIPCFREPWLYLAFNKDVVDEAKGRMPDGGVIKTINSMGLQCWRDGNGKALTIPKKMSELMKEYINGLKGSDRAEASDSYFDILAAVAMAKHLGYVPEGKFQHARRLCDQGTVLARVENRLSPLCTEIFEDLLFKSIKAAYGGALDFDDQVYMPALFGGSFPRYPNVLVDERQDLSPVNDALLDRLVKGRICAVGDRWQAIYGFRGAETAGMDKAKAKFNMTEKALSISFRCPEAIVKAAHWRVPSMRWLKPGGTYEVLSSLDIDNIPDSAAIICRNNAPLFRAAFGLLSRKRSVQVAGSDIGPKIVRLLGKIGTSGDSSDDLVAKINAWQQSQLEKTNSPQTTMDTAECLKVFASWGANFDQALGYANHIFNQRGKIQLITGHKAKGREWDTVFHLDPHLISKDEQDLNLRYVITTRAKQELYEIATKDVQW